MRRWARWAVCVYAAALFAVPKPSLAQQAAAPRPVTLNFEARDIRKALKQLFESSGLSYSLDPKVHGNVTTSLREVPFRAALDTVLRSGNPDQPLTYRMENGIYSIAPKPESGVEEARVQTMKISLYAASAQTLVNQLKQQSPLRETPTFTYHAYPTDNTIVVSGTEDQIRGLKEGIRLLDVQARQVSIRAELVLVAEGDDPKKKGRVIWSPTVRGFAGQDMTVRTDVKNGGEAAWQGGSNSLKVKARLNGDGTISLDADWEADLSVRVSGAPDPRRIVHSASGSLRCASGETVVLTGAIVKLGGKGPDSQLLLFLTPMLLPESADKNLSR
jgi:type II secretory pathway component GspD/PulD (secretin)